MEQNNTKQQSIDVKNTKKSTEQFVSRGSKKMTKLLASLDFVVTRQTALHNLMKKYLLSESSRQPIIKIFSDHCMNDLSRSTRCPMHRKQKSKEDTDENVPPNFQSIQLRSKMDYLEEPIPPKKSSPILLQTQKQTDLLAHMIFDKDIALDAFSDEMTAESMKQNIIPQSLIKQRECNKMMGDSMHHFLILYFQAIWQDTKSVDSKADIKDTIVVERYLKYLIILHKDYLTGNYPRKQRIDHYDRLYPVEEKHDDDETDELNENNEISLDEYRIFVEYMCQLFENSVMRIHPTFRQSDLILVQSMRYHLVKLSLMLAGEIPSSLLVRTRSNSILRRFMSLSKKSIHKLKSRRWNRSSSTIISEDFDGVQFNAK